MTRKILVIGASSFIARHWRAETPHQMVVLPHDGLSTAEAFKADVIVNCATAPAFKTGAYHEADDCDLAAARLAAETGAHLVMLSSRKVYAPSRSTIVLDESAPLGPDGWYGANKLESERRIAALLGDRCTILRIANVYGREYGRSSFFGMALSRLKNEGRIVLDVSPFVERDFIPVSGLADVLNRVCMRCPSGVFNVGSGERLALGRIAQWLILGYGRGTLEVTEMAERDAFVMNPGKLCSVLAHPASPHNFETDIKNIGRSLLDE